MSQLSIISTHSSPLLVSDTQTHRHTDTQTHRRTDAQTHRRTDAQTQRRRDAETQRRRDAETQRRTDAQTHRRTDAQTHRRTDAQTHRRTDAQTHRRTDTQTHRHTDTLTVFTVCHPRNRSRDLSLQNVLFLSLESTPTFRTNLALVSQLLHVSAYIRDTSTFYMDGFYGPSFLKGNIV